MDLRQICRTEPMSRPSKQPLPVNRNVRNGQNEEFGAGVQEYSMASIDSDGMQDVQIKVVNSSSSPAVKLSDHNAYPSKLNVSARRHKRTSLLTDRAEQSYILPPRSH